MKIPERANDTDPVLVLVAPELVTELGEWSRPVQVRIERRNGAWEMIARTHICPEPMRVRGMGGPGYSATGPMPDNLGSC